MTAENKSLVSAEIAGRKVRRKNFIRRAILGVLFFFGVIFCSITAAGLLASSFLVENILSLFGFVLAAVLLVLFERWLVYREKKTNSRHNVLLCCCVHDDGASAWQILVSHRARKEHKCERIRP